MNNIKETIDKITLILDVYHMSEESRLELTNLLKQQREEAVRGLFEVNYHYWRECHNCGYAGNNYLHCVHDGVQSRCVRCGEELPTIEGECECEFCITEKDIEEYLSQQREKGEE